MKRALGRFVLVLEWVSTGLLGIMAVLSVGSFFTTLASMKPGLFSTEAVMALLDELLVLFLIIELFKMASAYMSGQNIIPVALEAVTVALARKGVALELSQEGAFKKAAALALLIASVGVAWFLMGRTRWGEVRAQP